MEYRSAIITGASRGLGRVLARTLALRGLNVLMVARSETELRTAAESIREECAREERSGVRVEYCVADICDANDLARVFETARGAFEAEGGAADVLINNAGVGTYKPFLEWTDQEIADTLAVNLTALIACCRAALPAMIAQKRGYIVNIASDLSRRYLPNMAPYVAAKFGVLGFSGSLLREVKQYGIKVTTVMPGIIDTNFNNSQEGTREETWALRPDVIAAQVADLLALPTHVVVDELTLHPMQQEF